MSQKSQKKDKIMIVEKMNDEYVFSCYLEETKNKIEGEFTTLKWLQFLDQDSLKMLDSYLNNFQENVDPEDVNDTEVADLLTLVNMLIELEGVKEYEVDSKEIALEFMALIVAEGLSRKGLIAIDGTGKITEENCIKITENGTIIQNMIKEEKEENGFTNKGKQ